MKSWLVNSNSKEGNLNSNGFRYMLQQNRVMAFYDRRTEIDKIQTGDLVLLYHNQTGVIAVGFALKTELHDFDDFRKIEHWKAINWIWKAIFNEKTGQFENAIDRKIIGISNVFGTVLEINNLNLQILVAEIGKSQNTNL